MSPMPLSSNMSFTLILFWSELVFSMETLRSISMLNICQFYEVYVWFMNHNETQVIESYVQSEC